MEISVRAFVFDDDGNVLLVQHDAGQMWVLPGGHVEEGENIYDALQREIQEELGVDIVVLGSDIQFRDHYVVSYPLPISIHKIKYDHRERGEIEKLEYVFFARIHGNDDIVESEEIYRWQRFSSDEILSLEGSKDIPGFIQDILEQNEDLLELL